MKRKASAFISIIATLVIVLLTSCPVENVRASTTSYSIERVNHTIEVIDNGYVLINDTIEINGTASSFLIGFPYKYGQHILRCTAYNATETFPVSLNVPFENHTGFYAIAIDFPQGAPQKFSAGFLLTSDLLVRPFANVSQLDFPAYPGLTEQARICNVSILLPEGSEYVGGTVDSLKYGQENLRSFIYSPGNITFTHPEYELHKFDIDKLERKIKIGGSREIEVSDKYKITSQDVKEVGSFEIVLLRNASEPSASGPLGRSLKITTTGEPNKYEVLLRLALDQGESTVFIVTYLLPQDVYIEQRATQNFVLTFPLFHDINYYINQSSTTFVLPEGGKILDFENISDTSTYSMTKDIFQEALTIKQQSVLSLDSFNITVTYEYNALWQSFRPTLWMWTIAIIGSVVALTLKRTRAPAPVSAIRVEMGISPDEIKTFVETYERKQRIGPKLKSLEMRAQKGKISRRQYKVRRKTLETQLKTISRKLTVLETKLRASGGRHRDMIHRLEVAETEINEVETNIRSIQIRHRRGELSLAAYRKLLSEYERRKDRSETAINEILIRLREEIH